MAGIVQAAPLSAPTISRILDRLENVGDIVGSRAGTDHRKVCVLLTESRRTRIEDFPAPPHEQSIDRLNQLPPKERIGLHTALERLVELMGSTGIDTAPVLTPKRDETNRLLSMQHGLRRFHPAFLTKNIPAARSSSRANDQRDVRAERCHAGRRVVSATIVLSSFASYDPLDSFPERPP